MSRSCNVRSVLCPVDLNVMFELKLLGVDHVPSSTAVQSFKYRRILRTNHITLSTQNYSHRSRREYIYLSQFKYLLEAYFHAKTNNLIKVDSLHVHVCEFELFD